MVMDFKTQNISSSILHTVLAVIIVWADNLFEVRICPQDASVSVN